VLNETVGLLIWSVSWFSVTRLVIPFPILLVRVSFALHAWEAVMGRTIPSWRIIVEEEIIRLSRFKQFLGPEDRAVFDDLLSQCKLSSHYPRQKHRFTKSLREKLT